MKDDKWLEIEAHIHKYINECDFDKALQLLKQVAIEKANEKLQQDIIEAERLLDILKKSKQNGHTPFAEIKANEDNLVFKLNQLMLYLTKEHVTVSTFEPIPQQTTFEIDYVDCVSIEMPASAVSVSSVEVLAPPPICSPVLMPIPKAKMEKKSAAKPKNRTEGGILYHIPSKMQLGVQTKCIIRLAFDKSQLKKTTDTFNSEIIKTVQVSDVMEVDLIDTSGEDAFKIQFISQKEQFIDRESASEWLVNVKPLKAGDFSLALKVAIIEKIDGKDRRKEMILEEFIAIVSDHVAPSSEFKSANQPFQAVGVQSLLPSNTPSVKTVLFMGANPPGTPFLQLEIEHSRISVELEGKFRFPTSKFLSASEIPKLFVIHKPNVVHFSGHGKDPSGNNFQKEDSRGISLPVNYEKTGGIIVFDDDMRGMKIIDDKMLDFVFSNAVKKLKIPIEVVVFNSCHSESQAKVIGKSVPFVIGTAYAIKDNIAIAFAVGFYFGLGNGLSVEEAFTSGKMQAVMEDLEAEKLIVLYKNGKKLDL